MGGAQHLSSETVHGAIPAGALDSVLGLESQMIPSKSSVVELMLHQPAFKGHSLQKGEWEGQGASLHLATADFER